MKENIISISLNYIQLHGLEIAGRLFSGIGVFILIYIIIKYIINKVKNKIEGESLISDDYSKKNSKLVGSILFILLMIFNILATFEIIGFNTAIIMGGISLSIGFAMETTIGNLVSGVFILTNKKVKLGDFVEFLGKLKIRGTIEEINIRYTVIRSFDKRRIIIPNSVIAKTPIKTLKSEPLLKGEIEFKVSRKTSFDDIKQTFKQIISQNTNLVYPEYSSIIIESFGSKGLHLKGYFFCSPAKKMPLAIAREIRSEFVKQLKTKGIEIPYKHMTVSTE
ncbi:MAG: mechanosensitive ion channel family protein [Candidatus Absconditabacteria bacterium]|nr:mechanosensitive ion channel family protein [Candidatus Absconditabacteria bacterium]